MTSLVVHFCSAPLVCFVDALDIGDLLERAGYDDDAPENLEDEEIANIERSYRFVIDDPKLRSCVKPEPPPSLDTKRFIVEIYEKYTGRQIL